MERAHQHRPPTSRVAPNKNVRDVRDGKVFHVRMTIFTLSGVVSSEREKKTMPKTSAQDNAPVAVFASLEPDVVSSDHDFAVSQPLEKSNDCHYVVWPKTLTASTPNQLAVSGRRLYFSALLGRDENPIKNGDGNLQDDDSGTSSAPGAESFLPEMVEIRLSMIKNKEKLPLGYATLVVSPREVSGQLLDLPVRLATNEIKHSRTSRKNIFGGKKKSKIGDLVGSRFSKDQTIYALEPNAVLRVRLDVKSDLQSWNGPSVWGDDGDDETLVPDGSPVNEVKIIGTTDMTQQGMTTVDGQSEAIEVFDNRRGTTIFSAPDVNHTGTDDLSTLDDSIVSSVYQMQERSFLVDTVCGAISDATCMEDQHSLNFDDATIDTNEHSTKHSGASKSIGKSDTCTETQSDTVLDTLLDKDEDSTDSVGKSSLPDSVGKATKTILMYASRSGIDPKHLVGPPSVSTGPSTASELGSTQDARMLDEETTVESRDKYLPF